MKQHIPPVDRMREEEPVGDHSQVRRGLFAVVRRWLEHVAIAEPEPMPLRRIGRRDQANDDPVFVERVAKSDAGIA